MRRGMLPTSRAGTVLAIVLLSKTVAYPLEAVTPPAPPVSHVPPSMTADEIRSFLAQPLIARLATVRRNCTPQIVPMWFLYADGVLYMSTRTQAAKLKHLRAHPQVAVVVDVMQAPLKNKSVTLQGRAEVLTTGVKEMTTRIYEKYMGKDAAASAAAQHNINEPRVILKITPKTITSIDTTR